MALAPKTVYTYPLDGSNREFNINFEYLTRKFVQITLIGQDRKQLVLNQDFRFTTRTSIQTTIPWGPSQGYETIEIRRFTSATERLVDFADGSILRAYDLNISGIQGLHIAEEARDLSADTIAVNNDGDLDARGRRIVNLADATQPSHAVTLRQEQEWAASTLGNKNASETARVGSESARDAAVAAAGRTSVSEVNAKASADSAKVDAQTAKDEVAKINTQVSEATTQANRAKTEADRSSAQADRSKAQADLSEASKVASTASAVRSEAAAAIADTAGLQLGMSSWGYRAQPFRGFGLDDGQEFDRAVYPDFAAALDAGMFPVVAEALWQSDPKYRGCFVAVSSPGKFRMRDLNGATAGSIGAVFQRGSLDQYGGIVKKDQLGPMMYADNVADTTSNPYIRNGTGRNAILTRGLATGQPQAAPVGAATDGSQWITNTGPETTPKHVTGAWMTRLYGVVAPLGAAEANSLATAYASMATRIGSLEAWRAQRSQVYDSGFLYYGVGETFYNLQHGLPFQPDCFSMTLRARVATSNGWPIGTIVNIPIGMDHAGSNVGYGTEIIQPVGANYLRIWIGRGWRPASMNSPGNNLAGAVITEWDMRMRAWSSI